MKLKPFKRRTRGFTLVELLVVIAIIAGLASISAPIMLRQIKRARIAQAVTKSQDVTQALYSYHFQAGHFINKNSSHSSSNDYLRTLFITGNTSIEKPFHLKTSLPGSIPNPPDENTNGNQALSAGENSWSYFYHNSGETSLVAHANTPLIATPLAASSNDISTLLGDTLSFNNRLVVTRIDKSAIVYDLNADGTIQESDVQWGSSASELRISNPEF